MGQDLNMVEIFFNLVQTKVVARGVFPSKSDLVVKLLAFVEKFNQEGKRFRKRPPLDTRQLAGGRKAGRAVRRG